MNYVISGGIGDFLQCLPHFLSDSNPNNKYLVVSHFREAQFFFDAVGKSVAMIETYSNNEELNAILSTVSRLELVSFCPRTKYFDYNPFGPCKPLFNNDLRVIGVHLNGSRYAEKVNHDANLPSKNIPLSLLDVLSKYKCNVVLFGSYSEVKLMQIEESDSLKVISQREITDSLSFMSICDVFVGCDSAFKTMSSMLKKATLVWLPDYDDKFRDNVFINPYVSDCIMKTVRFSSAEYETMKEATNKTEEFLKENGFAKSYQSQ